MKFALFVLAAVLLAAPAFGKVFTRCGLAQEMYRLGTPKSELPKWTCIAQYESSYNTAAVGPTNYNGSNDYGIFQINDYWWCQPASGKFSYNECALSCSNLLTDDITRSVTCARKIKSQQGWTAWSVYNKYCSGTLASVDSCF